MDLSIIQGPVSVAPCQTRISRFAIFFIAVEQAAVKAGTHHLGLTVVACGLPSCWAPTTWG